MVDELKRAFPGSKITEKDGKFTVKVNVFKLLSRKFSYFYYKNHKICTPRITISVNNPDADFKNDFSQSVGVQLEWVKI